MLTQHMMDMSGDIFCEQRRIVAKYGFFRGALKINNKISGGKRGKKSDCAVGGMTDKQGWVACGLLVVNSG
ncbi:hypothetical protein [Nitrosomonas sp. ANs5]|uniref:hypothetical protein n=1 Tax=Nitrosomonas sp. ANs5 TaxID=3423941 RepID=UPI003D32F8B9